MEVANCASLPHTALVPRDTSAPAASAPAVTPMAFARAIVVAYERHAKSPAAALQLAQIAPTQLRDPNARMTAAQMETLAAAAMQELDDEGLAAYGRKLPWGSYGMLARASLSAPDLGLALKRWCRHHALLIDDVRLTLSASGPQATVSVQEQADLGDLRELTLAFLLRNVHGLACWYIDSRIPLLEAGLPFPAPPHADAYAHMFPGSLRFGTRMATLQFDAAYLALPLRRGEKDLRLMLQRALPIPVRPYRRDRLLVQQVRQALGNHPQECHNAEGVANLLHVSTRTLHRQLKDEGASLQGLKDEVRLERARDLLYRSTKPMKQVAAAVGFQSEKSFNRAFRQWTGTTPAKFRSGDG